MPKIISLPASDCRYLRYGRCSNFFWHIMKTAGKPGLRDYTCLLWQEKMDKIVQFWDATRRVNRFDLSGEERQKLVDRTLARQDSDEAVCPDFKPAPTITANQCLYHYLQACLLKFPACSGRCDDYIHVGDQRSGKA